MKYDFSNSIMKSIEQTYTYAYAKNGLDYVGSADTYDPITFFIEQLEIEPFETFLRLDGFAFKKTLNTLNRYGVPYTQEQQRKAKAYYELTEKMQRERSDYVSMYVEEIPEDKVIKLSESFVLTTRSTLEVANWIKQLPATRYTNNVVFESKVNPSLLNEKEQFAALSTCVTQHISCLVGGAGTGKSFVTAEIIRQLKENGLVVAILAPTHKAREALQEKLGNLGQVRTIHSFVHNPFDCDAIVIDESGMLSTPLCNQLRRVYDDQQLIFVGDKNQIPPVEYGRPFEHILERFTTSELTENRRSEAKDIIALGREILGIPQNANLGHDNIDVVATVKEAYECGAEVLLTYTNASVREANEIQRVKNGEASISSLFSIGDKIIAKTNDKGRFYNGQLFVIVGWNRIRNEKTGGEIKIKSARDLEYNFDLAYGLTIHKSQGSEWDVVAYEPSDLDTKNLAYVAVTRAKKKLIIVGDKLRNEYLDEKRWKQIYEFNSI